MRPLWRWTIGEVSEVGWEIFSESVRQAVKVYPEFDFVICHNNLSLEEVIFLKKWGVPLHSQKFEYPFQYCEKNQTDYSWKLVPPRLRMDAHELWVDNDLVIRDRIPEIDQWLVSQTTMISASKEVISRYGRFTDSIDPWIKCCAGFFGLPPGFDLEARINELCMEPLVNYDEQGLVTKIVTGTTGWIEVDFENLKMLGSWNPERIGMPHRLPPGVHFVGSNRAKTKEWKPWLCYKLRTMP